MQNMYVRVNVVAGAKKEVVTKVGPLRYDMCVQQHAERNLANKRVRELVAKEALARIEDVRIISGHRSPHKIFSIKELK